MIIYFGPQLLYYFYQTADYIHFVVKSSQILFPHTHIPGRFVFFFGENAIPMFDPNIRLCLSLY